jgi:hypothetical protein
MNQFVSYREPLESGANALIAAYSNAPAVAAMVSALTGMALS